MHFKEASNRSFFSRNPISTFSSIASSKVEFQKKGLRREKIWRKLQSKRTKIDNLLRKWFHAQIPNRKCYERLMIIQGCVISCEVFRKSRNLTRSMSTNQIFYCDILECVCKRGSGLLSIFLRTFFKPFLF